MDNLKATEIHIVVKLILPSQFTISNKTKTFLKKYIPHFKFINQNKHQRKTRLRKIKPRIN